MVALPAAGYFNGSGRTNQQAKDAQDAVLAFVRQVPGCETTEALTIATGAVTPSKGFVVLDTEAGASTDDLANIAQPTGGLPDGAWLAVAIADPSRVVVVKHAAGGTGQVLLSDGADLTLTDPSCV